MIDATELLSITRLAGPGVDPTEIKTVRISFNFVLVPGTSHTFSAFTVPVNTFLITTRFDIDSYPTIANIAHPEWRVPYSWIDPLYLQWLLNNQIQNPGTGSPYADYRLFMNDQFNVFNSGSLVLKVVVNTTTINGNAINGQNTYMTLKGYLVPKTQTNDYLTRISERRFAAGS